MSQGQKKRLIAVDDSRVALLNIKRMLSNTEFELVGSARSGEEAITLYQEHQPDLVLLDIVMPDMDGIQILEGIRAINPSAAVVMASSLGSQEKVMECTEKGASSFLMKPYEKDDLLKVLLKVTEEQ